MSEEYDPNWGGAREGSGRMKKSDKERAHNVTIMLPGWMRDELDKEARRLKVTRSRLVVVILKQALARRAANRKAKAS